MTTQFHGRISSHAHTQGPAPSSSGITPGVPTGVTSIAAGGTTGTTTWTAGSPAGTGFDVQIESPSGANNWTNATGTRTGTSFAHTGLTPYTSYRTRVRATDGAQQSAYANSSEWFTDNTGIGGGPIAAEITGSALLSGAVSTGTIGINAATVVSGNALVGGARSTGGIASVGPATLLGSAVVGGAVSTGFIISLLPAQISGAAFVSGAVSSGVIAGNIPAFTPAVPRLAFRQRTGELFPLVLDAENVPIAYRPPGGEPVTLRFLDRVTLGVAISEPSGETLIII